MGGSKDSIWQKIMLYGLEYIGLFYGSYRAFVVNNNDPDKLNRLQLRIPHLNSNSDDDTWAFPVGNWGGKGHGVQMVPSIGDMVWVEFQYGNVDYPIWKHASYALDEIPTEFKTVKHYGFKTPNGTILLIDDNKDQESILMKLNSDSDWVKVNKDTIEIESQIIKLGSKGEEAAIMGNTLNGLLQNIMDELDSLQQQIILHTHPAPNIPSSNVSALQIIKGKLNTIKTKLPSILSNKVKIDK